MPRKKTDPNELSLFGNEEGRNPGPASPYARENRDRLKRWASRGIYFGTSSWKYPGWKGMVYVRDYGSKKAFEQECIREYSELFPTVCADFALYSFPDAKAMKALHDVTADDFRISLKVTDRITIKRYPNLPRHGAYAGKENPDFLNVELFEDAFLRPIDELRAKKGVIIFEFSAFTPASGMTYDAFVEKLGAFLGRLPGKYSYAVEIRNSDYLAGEYLGMLRSHGAGHVLNNWTRMPPIIDQIKVAGVLTAGFTVARALLAPGRTYEQAVEKFSPYEKILEVNPDLRHGLAETVQRCIAEKKELYAYVNNRAEGNSPKTIEAILDILDSYPVEKL
jgi:uncharacterized protein YecE (DUF72 family)